MWVACAPLFGWRCVNDHRLDRSLFHYNGYHRNRARIWDVGLCVICTHCFIYIGYNAAVITHFDVINFIYFDFFLNEIYGKMFADRTRKFKTNWEKNVCIFHLLFLVLPVILSTFLCSIAAHSIILIEMKKEIILCDNAPQRLTLLWAIVFRFVFVLELVVLHFLFFFFTFFSKCFFFWKKDGKTSYNLFLCFCFVPLTRVEFVAHFSLSFLSFLHSLLFSDTTKNPCFLFRFTGIFFVAFNQ